MTINKGKLAFFSLALNGIFVLFFAGKRYYYAHSAPAPSIVPEDIWNISRNSELKTLPIDTGDIVFVGNSITEGFPVNEVFHSLKVKNRGIGWNQSRHILGRIEEIAAAKSKKIFLDAGINDILNNVPLDTILRNYAAIVQKVRELSPGTKLYVQSVFPVGESKSAIEPEVDELDRRLKIFCAAHSLPYIDIYSGLVLHGQLNTAFTLDDIHLNGKGYEIWKRAVDSLVK